MELLLLLRYYSRLKDYISEHNKDTALMEVSLGHGGCLQMDNNQTNKQNTLDH